MPDEYVLGGVGNGWKVALTTLMNERAGLAFFLQVRLRQVLDQVVVAAAERGLMEDPSSPRSSASSISRPRCCG